MSARTFERRFEQEINNQVATTTPLRTWCNRLLALVWWLFMSWVNESLLKHDLVNRDKFWDLNWEVAWEQTNVIDCESQIQSNHIRTRRRRIIWCLFWLSNEKQSLFELCKEHWTDINHYSTSGLLCRRAGVGLVEEGATPSCAIVIYPFDSESSYWYCDAPISLSEMVPLWLKI